MDELNELPQGWKWVKLEDLASQEDVAFKIGPFGSSLRKDELINIGIPVFGIENILANKFYSKARRFISQNKFEELAAYKIQTNDILISTMGTIGRTAVIPENIEKSIFDSHLLRIRVNQKEAYPFYISYVINGDDFKKQLAMKSSGAIMAGINTKIIKSCFVPLPPFPEQQRLATLLTAKLSLIEQAKEKITAQLQAAQELTTAYLREVFESEEAKGWELVELKNENILIIDGDRGVNYPNERDFFIKEHCLFLNTKNVRQGFFSFEKTAFITKKKDSELRQGKTKRNDLILTTRGTVGNVALYDDNVSFEHIRINSGMVIIRTNNDFINPRFLLLLFLSDFIKNQFIDSSSGSAQPQLPINVLKTIKIVRPSISKQEKIISYLSEKLATVEQLKTTLQTQLDSINQLPAALLKQAFSGKL